MIEKKVYIEKKDMCTFGTLSQVWDNGIIKIAYIKVPKYYTICITGKKVELDFICSTFDEIKFI